jgi:HemX protein
MLAAFVLQTAGLLLEGMRAHRCPLGSMADALAIVSWSLVVIHGVVGAAYRMSLLGLLTSALAAAFSIASVVIGVGRVFPEAQTLVLVHAWLSLFSFGAFGILALVSSMYLIQLYGLKKHNLAPFFDTLPSLRELERANYRLLTAAAAVFSVAIALGAWRYVFSGGEVSEAKLLFALAVWTGYAAALGMRIFGALHGRKLALALVALFFLAVAALVPVGLGHARVIPPPASKEVVR